MVPTYSSMGSFPMRKVGASQEPKTGTGIESSPEVECCATSELFNTNGGKKETKILKMWF
jgi:hypothetical protein